MFPSEDEDTIGLINGQTPGSREEWRVAKALWKLGHRFMYQFQLFGGYIRGGQILDFLVLTTVPASTAIQVNGEYWHKGRMASEEQFKLARLIDYFRKQGSRVVVLWASDLQTDDDVFEILSREIGRA